MGQSNLNSDSSSSHRQSMKSLLKQVLEEVEHGISLIQRLGLERAGNRINSFRPQL